MSGLEEMDLVLTGGMPEAVAATDAMIRARKKELEDEMYRSQVRQSQIRAALRQLERLGNESNLVKHARCELELSGQTTEDPAWAETLIVAIRAISSYGHSGGSIFGAIGQLMTLLQLRPLSPLTSNPDEWMDQSAASGGHPMWQSTRDPAAFSQDGGKTWYYVDDRKEKPRLLRDKATGADPKRVRPAIDREEWCELFRHNFLGAYQRMLDATEDSEMLAGLSDLRELVDHLIDIHGYTRFQAEQVRVQRFQELGGFAKQLVYTPPGAVEGPVPA